MFGKIGQAMFETKKDREQLAAIHTGWDEIKASHGRWAGQMQAYQEAANRVSSALAEQFSRPEVVLDPENMSREELIDRVRELEAEVTRLEDLEDQRLYGP